MDIHSAADMLVLIGAIQDKHNLEATCRPLFPPSRRGPAPAPDPTQTLSTGVASSTSFDFQSASVLESIKSLSEPVTKLTKDLAPHPSPPQPTRHPAASSYALVESRHAPGRQGGQQQPQAANRPKQTKPPQRGRTLNTVTLSQLNPATPALATKTTLHLVKVVNLVLKEANVRLKDTDKSSI